MTQTSWLHKSHIVFSQGLYRGCSWRVHDFKHISLFHCSSFNIMGVWLLSISCAQPPYPSSTSVHHLFTIALSSGVSLMLPLVVVGSLAHALIHISNILTVFAALLLVAMLFRLECSYRTYLFLSSVFIFLPFSVKTMSVVLVRRFSSMATFNPIGIG
jgi:hypothetical protein